MDIQIPPDLQWVSYLAGGEWPQGSETKMFRISEHFADAARELQDLIPDLNRVRNETLSVLFGDTAMAAQHQFAMLFGGDYSVDKLAQGAVALGDGANNFGSEAQYGKLSIIAGLAMAAAEIAWCLANEVPTGGASTAAIPAVEAMTRMSIRRIVWEMLRRIETNLGQMMTRTTIKHLVHEGIKESFQELGQGLLQEGVVQGIQVGQGTAKYRPDLFRQNAIASFVGGAAGGATAAPVARGLGPARSQLGAAVKGVTTFFSAGVAGNVAGTVSVGGEFDTISVLAGSASSSIGGIKGGGVHAEHGGHQGADPHAEPPPPSAPTPEGPPPDLSPVGPSDGSQDGSQRADSTTAAPEPRVDTSSTNGHTTHGSDGAGVAGSPSPAPLPAAARHTNDAAAQHDSPAHPLDDRKSTDDDAGGSDAAPPSKHTEHTGDAVDPPTHSPDAHPESGAPVTDTTPAPTHNVHSPDVHASAETSQSFVDPPVASHADTAPAVDPSTHADASPTASDVDPAVAQDHPAATPATPATSLTSGSPATHTPTPAAAAPPTTHVQTQASEAPKPTVRNETSSAPPPAASTSKASETPAARVQDNTAARAQATARGDDVQAAVARVTADDRTSTPRVDQATVAGDAPVRPRADCADRVAQALSQRYGRRIELAPFSTSEGAPARVLYETFGSRAEFASYSEVGAVLRQMEPGSSAIVTSSWAGGPSRGGHAYLAVNEGGHVYFEDPLTGTRSGWPPHWGESSVSRTAVGYLNSHGEAVHPLRERAGELAAAGVVGHVQGLPGDGDAAHHGDHDPALDHGNRSSEQSPDVSDTRHQPPEGTFHGKAVADEALAHRGISADQLVNDFRHRDEALARARDNAAWWAGLTDVQRDALIHSYPRQVGLAEGIFTDDRDTANRLRFKYFRDKADEIQARLDRGVRPDKEELKFLLRVNKIDTALHNGAMEAARAGVGGPKLLYFDPREFGRDGRVIVSFGEDPYKADVVAWLVPGFGTTIDKLNKNMRNALHLLQSTLREEPTVSASSITWIGYDAPNDMHAARVIRPGLARAGGEYLFSDITAFNAARDTLAGDGSHFTGNHVFAHSYGSTTASYAGQGERLANHVRTVTLLGSPGAGRLHHADDFGIGADNVFVASSSRDPVTSLGGRVPGHFGRIIQNLGLGLDPAMSSFGAVRVTAEFPAALNTTGTIGTHTAYLDYVDQVTHPPVRTESLANFGRVIAGHSYDVHTDEHRTVDESRRRPGTLEPAADRQLRLDGDTGLRHSRDRHLLNRLNPRWRGGDAREADRVTGELAAIDEDAEPTSEIDVDTPPGLDPEVARIANEALAQRVPPVAADGLVNPLDRAVVAEARARHNAAWWSGLTDEQRHALIRTHPREIGNAEGVYAEDRDTANRNRLDGFRDRAAQVQAKLAEGVKLTPRELDFLLRMNKLDIALHNAAVAADRAGVGRPLLLAFDPLAFGGDGRALVSFGEDPYKADAVAWYVPGLGTTLDKLDYSMNCALNTLQSSLREEPTLSAASIAWIGYDAPNDGHTWRVMGKGLARNGGEILYSDVRAFNAARDTFAGDGTHFTGNHIFGHSYGSTTTSFAGRDGRLAGHISTVTLVGSPGAGPLRHARDFGIDQGRVYVASSSRDPVSMAGGRTPGSHGRAGIGLGMDPMMRSFGGTRVTAEFPASMDRKDTTATHNAYFDYLETDGPREWLVTPQAAARTESLANFGRILADHTERLHHEPNRTIDVRPRWKLGWRTIEPAGDRPLRLEVDPGGQFAGDRDAHHRFNPRWRQSHDCAHLVADQLSEMYGQHIHLDEGSSQRGVSARALFDAVGSRSQFATYDDVAETLRRLGDGSSALMASRWARTGGRYSGHAYLAVNVDGEIHLHDPFTRERTGWPPYWGQDAVAQTAVGYLDADGRPIDPAGSAPAGRSAVDKIGYVQGLQGEYHAQDPTTRDVDTRWAEPLGTVVDNPSEARVNQLAEDLSGVYGPHRIRLEGEVVNGDVMLTGRIFHGDTEIGTIQRVFYRDGDGNLVAYHSGLVISEEFAHLRGQGFSKALTSELERYYVHSGVDRIELHTHDKGGYSWARRGFTWDPDPLALQKSLAAIKVSAHQLSDQVGPEARAALDRVVRQLDPRNPRLPEPVDIANLATPDEPALGRRLLDGLGLRRDGSGLDLVRYMPRGPAADATAQSHSGFGARLKHMLGLGSGARSNQDCAHVVADELSTMYGRDISVATARSLMGVPAWALFEAVGSNSRFATYDEVADRLRELGDGSSAVLASRWAGRRSGGHAYLAVNDGGRIHLYDPSTRERSGWPPHWGQDAVTRTAAGYLDANGNPVDPIGLDVPLRLHAADSIGDVQGHPSEPDPAVTTEQYRAQDPATRQVDTRHAEPLGDVVDNLDGQQVRRLADDLEGVYGPYRVEMWRAEPNERRGEVIIGGSILNGDEEVGFLQRTFYRDAAGNLVVHDDVVDIPDDQFRFKGFSKALTDQLESYYARCGVDRIEMRTEQDGGHAWARRGFTWAPDPARLQDSLRSIKESALQLRETVGPEARAVIDEMVERLDPTRADLPEPIDLAALATPDTPDLGRRLLTDTMWHGVKYLSADVDAPSPDVPLQLGTVAALPDPVGELGLPDYPSGSLSDVEASAVHSNGELRLRELNEQLVGDGVGTEDRARILAGHRNSLREWVRELMSNRVTAEVLAANESNPTFDDLVARNEERGLVGEAAYQAIIKSATHGRFTPGTLSDVETTSVYSDFELRLRELNEQLVRDGVRADERARLLSELRGSLRAWTRELMSNRTAADWLAENESSPSFEELVARNEHKGLTGDAVYEAIVDSATHSHYAAETLSDPEARTVYTTFELRMRDVREQLQRDGVGLEERARSLYALRASIRTWTRSLMANRETAEFLIAHEPNPTFEELVERQRTRGRVGDEIYEAIIASATRSRASVNEAMGVDPEHPPDLPPMRGPTGRQ
ncbi:MULTISPECIES: alpha/beta hydrolase [unclassified Mycobacterium]|uniref:alpha/beta hydrolase n=1 Tax=unclassified Mycobacterium TaxID=2642494 RepID=UPI0029C6F7F9|nr:MULTISPECIES: alpha/beta hydrolase [unclassified Mycobacterium]